MKYKAYQNKYTFKRHLKKDYKDSDVIMHYEKSLQEKSSYDLMFVSYVTTDLLYYVIHSYVCFDTVEEYIAFKMEN